MNKKRKLNLRNRGGVSENNRKKLLRLANQLRFLPDYLEFLIGKPDGARYVWAKTPKRVRKIATKHRGTIIGEDENGCGVEGCTGTPFLVEWPDGEVTTCCTKGMHRLENGDYQL